MADFADVDTLAARYQERGGQPGLAYGIVVGGELVHAVGLGERHLGGNPGGRPHWGTQLVGGGTGAVRRVRPDRRRLQLRARPGPLARRLRMAAVWAGEFRLGAYKSGDGRASVAVELAGEHATLTLTLAANPASGLLRQADVAP
jgi:hypothetical protein